MADQSMADPGLMTRWGKAVDPEHVLEEYPRPGMVRDNFMILNGRWDYAISGSEQFPREYDGKILVPFSPEAPLSGAGRILQPGEFLHYERPVRITVKENVRYLLHFGAVDQSCRVYVNGRKAGSHTGGYLPFSIDLSGFLQDGENRIHVTVRDLSDTSFHAKGKQSLDRGGMWYTPQSGIWQTVWLEKVPVRYIRELKIDPDLDERSVRVKVLLNTGENIPVRFSVRFRGRKLLAAEGMTGISQTVGPLLLYPWTPETPDLYDLSVQTDEDCVLSYFAMRKISVEKDSRGILRLFLNNRPYYQNGVLDQGYYPDGLYTAPSDEAMVNDILRMKELGFNMLRKHIKIEPSRWYWHCDRLGMLVWQDMVCGGEPYRGWFVTVMPNLLPFTGRVIRDRYRKLFSREEEDGRKEFLREVRQTVRHLYNHPSIVLWTAFNEGWGQFDARKVTELIHRADPSRPVDEASGWFDQGGGEIFSIHNYFRRLKLPSHSDRCIALTEFGGYSYRVPHHTWNEEEYGYGKYRSKEELTEAVGSLWKRDLLRNIPKGLSASVYTQVSDVEDETNGLMTYDREEIKVDREKMIKINRDLLTVFERSL